jgi:hypothetical protein
MLAVFRLPLHLYRRGWRWMLGRTFLLLVHVGRTTGRSYETVAMVLGDDTTTGEVVICGMGAQRRLDPQPARSTRETGSCRPASLRPGASTQEAHT